MDGSPPSVLRGGPGVADRPRERVPERDRLLESPTRPPLTPRERERLLDRVRDPRAPLRERDLTVPVLLAEHLEEVRLRRETDEVREAGLLREWERAVFLEIVAYGGCVAAAVEAFPAADPLLARDLERDRDLDWVRERDRDLDWDPDGRLREDIVANLGRELERERVLVPASCSGGSAGCDVDLDLL